MASSIGIDAGRVLVAGISAGANMANAMAVSYPDLYAAVASVAGCAYLCLDVTGDAAYRRMGPHARIVPAILFLGTADPLFFPVLGPPAELQWAGTDDRADNGAADGSVSRTPTSIEQRGLDGIGVAPDLAGACIRPLQPAVCGGALGWDAYPYSVTSLHRRDRTHDRRELADPRAEPQLPGGGYGRELHGSGGPGRDGRGVRILPSGCSFMTDGRK